MKTIVKFTKPWGRYNRGEIAGFAPDMAARLIGTVAAAHDPAPVASVPAAPVTTAPAPAPAFEAAMAALEAEPEPAALPTAAPSDLPVQGRKR